MATAIWHDLSVAELDGILAGRVAAWLRTPVPGETAELLAATSAAGFDTTQLDAALSVPWTLDGHGIGEAVAAAVLEVKAGCSFPMMPWWDLRDPNTSAGGTDLVGFCTIGALIRFAFAEVKTSNAQASPPSVVVSGPHNLVKQIEKLRDDRLKRDTLVRYLQGRRLGSGASSFAVAAKAYLADHRDVHIFGALVRPRPKRTTDLSAAATKFGKPLHWASRIHLHGITLEAGIGHLDKLAASLKPRGAP